MTRTSARLELPHPSIKDRQRELGERSVKSAQRALELLELFEQLSRPVTLAEIVRASGYPQSSTWMLVQTLTRMGYLCHNPEDGTYMPSLRLNMLGGWVHDMALPRSNLRSAMHALGKRLGLSVVLGQRSGPNVQYAHVVYSGRDRDAEVPIGVVRPLIDTAMGYAILAQLPDDEVRRITNVCLLRRTEPGPVTDVEQAMSLVRRVREAGFAYSHRLQTAGRASFSFALGTEPGAGGAGGLLGLAVAGSRRAVQGRLAELPATINAVIAEFLPDVPVSIRDGAPIRAL